MIFACFREFIIETLGKTDLLNSKKPKYEREKQ